MIKATEKCYGCDSYKHESDKDLCLFRHNPRAKRCVHYICTKLIKRTKEELE